MRLELELGLQLWSAVAVVGEVRATGLQILLCMFSLFFVFLQTEKTFL